MPWLRGCVPNYLLYGRKLTSDEIKVDLIKAWLINANFGVFKIYVDLNECEFIKFIKFSERTTNNYFDCFDFETSAGKCNQI